MSVHQLKAPCFVLDPKPRRDDDDPHYDTRAEALDAACEAGRDAAEWWAGSSPWRLRLTGRGTVPSGACALPG